MSDIYYKHTSSQSIRSGAAIGSPWAVLGSGINNDQAKLETDTDAITRMSERLYEHDEYIYPFSNINLGITGVVAKASEGELRGYYIANNSSSVRYIKFYNKATVPVSGDLPVFTLPIPGNAAAHRTLSPSMIFSSGIAVKATTGVDPQDYGSPSTNDVVINIEYN